MTENDLPENEDHDVGDDMKRIAAFATKLDEFFTGQPQWVVVGAIGVIFGHNFETLEDARKALDVAKTFADLRYIGVEDEVISIN
jgi:hypothetical protein